MTEFFFWEFVINQKEWNFYAMKLLQIRVYSIDVKNVEKIIKNVKKRKKRDKNKKTLKNVIKNIDQVNNS